MQQAEMSSFIRSTINVNTQANQAGIQQPQANTQSAKKGNSLLNAAKEVGITAGMGLTGGLLAGGITALIPTKNIEGVSDTLCDTFVRSTMNTMGLAEEALPEVSFENAKEQLEKAAEYVKTGQLLENKDLNDDEIKTIGQKFSDAAWALKQSAVDYINKAAKEDGLLNFAKKEANKDRISSIMKNSVSIGIGASFCLLLFNMIGGFGKKENKTGKNAQK